MRGDCSPASAAAEKKATSTAISQRHTEIAETLLVDLPAETVRFLWSINPLHRILPINWAEAVRSLSTVSKKAAQDPLETIAAAEQLGLRLWAGSVQSWAAATARWWGLADASQKPEPTQKGDRRFDAPEWA